VSSRCLGRLEQRATPPHKRQHGRHGEQLPLRLRRGQLLRLTRRCSRRCTRSTSGSTSRCPTVSPHSLRWSWSCGAGSAALALRKHPSHRTRPPLIPPCAHRIYRTHPTTHAAYSQQHFSASPCTSPSAAGCTQGGRQALVRPHEVELREMPELSSTGHPVARDQLDQAGQDRRDQLLLLASRPVVLPRTRPAHRLTHA